MIVSYVDAHGHRHTRDFTADREHGARYVLALTVLGRLIAVDLGRPPMAVVGAMAEAAGIAS